MTPDTDPRGHDPRLIDEKHLNTLIRSSGRLLRIGTLAVVLLLAALLAVTSWLLYQRSQQTAQIQQVITRQLAGSCAFYRDVANAPVQATGPQRSTKLGIRILIDSRKAYDTAGCRPELEPPGRALVILAQQYQIPLPG